MKLLDKAMEAIDEIKELMDGRVDIDNNGNPNYAMRVMQELVCIEYAISKCKIEEENKHAATRTEQSS